MSSRGIDVIASKEKKELHEIKDLYIIRSEIENCFSVLNTDMDGNLDRSGEDDIMRGFELCHLLSRLQIKIY